MQHTKDINFPQIETTRFFPQNSHTQTKLQTYEFIILGVKPRHLLFQEKKKTLSLPRSFWLTAYNASLSSHYL